MTLEQKIADLLGRLSVLSEADAGNLEAHIARSAPESSPPPGGLRQANPTADAIRARSLYDWYRSQFEQYADNPDRLLSLYLAGEREYLRRTDPSVQHAATEKGSILAYSQDGAIVEQMAAEQILAEFEGVHALDVAIIIGKTEAWVLKVRRLHGRDPKDGRPRPEFLSLPESQREAAVHRLAEQMGSKQAVADDLGVDRKTVDRYWPTPELADAA